MEYRAAICPRCGNFKVLCHDPHGVHGEGYYPQRDVCWVTATREAAQRRWEQRVKDTEPDGGFLPGDGMTIWAALTDLAPDDDFLGLAEPPPAPTADDTLT